ncbi:uncharacterized protein BT62DRAFT_576396 [Guyanagaster necrorhizus]|uniref:Uncharacterized protein n=1 Tax=Guyanagaster necrorhizus TaxID=856835 RepID=A0A9P7VGR6_9AGAR|nr:uncharacterized protein BT62DRAFT_576396 [Guyanagaster necrorhizus MCA 3950]KAG7440716.1 hypothetical protein BT62DRAFT_576396 [Guyanagaster necrorhizus MCA 3950]
MSSFIGTKVQSFSCAPVAHRGPCSQGKLERHASLGEGYQCLGRYASEANGLSHASAKTTTIEYRLPRVFYHSVTGQHLRGQNFSLRP